jgi:hypothetical protein
MAKVTRKLTTALAEIGHLVLPESGHSPFGIMSSALDLRSAALPAFTLEQMAAIRQRVTSAN